MTEGKRALRVLAVSALLAISFLSLGASASAAGHTSPRQPSFSASSYAGGAKGVDYTVGFTTSAHGQLTANYGTITLQGPARTGFVASGAYQVNDLSSHQIVLNTGSGAATLSNGGATLTLTVDANVGPGQRLEVLCPNETNPPAGTTGVLKVLTSSDPVPVATESRPRGPASNRYRTIWPTPPLPSAPCSLLASRPSFSTPPSKRTTRRSVPGCAGEPASWPSWRPVCAALAR